MHAPRTSGGYNYGLRLSNLKLFCLHIKKNGTCSLTLRIQNDLDGSRKVHYRNASIEDFVTKGSHDLSTGIILCGMHPLSGGSAAVGGDHVALFIFIKFHSQVAEPLDSSRSVIYKLSHKLSFCREMTAAKCVHKMDSR